MNNIEYAKKVAISMCKRYSERGVTFVELYKTCLDKINELIEKHKDNPDYDISKDRMLEWHLRQELTRIIANKSGRYKN